jgi:hypothetical protein
MKNFMDDKYEILTSNKKFVTNKQRPPYVLNE